MICDHIELWPSLGQLYQGNVPDEQLRRLPQPLVIVNLQRSRTDVGFLDHQLTAPSRQCYVVMECAVEDNGAHRWPDNVYVGIITAIVNFLRNGMNVYVHCTAGVSRSSYVTMGVLMAALALSADDALAYLRKYHPLARPNDGFMEHLRHLGPSLWAIKTYDD